MVTDDNGDCGVEVEAPRDARDDSALRAIAEALAQGRPIIADTISSLLMMVLISIAAGEQAARSVSYALPDDSDEQARMRAERFSMSSKRTSSSSTRKTRSWAQGRVSTPRSGTPRTTTPSVFPESAAVRTVTATPTTSSPMGGEPIPSPRTPMIC